MAIYYNTQHQLAKLCTHGSALSISSTPSSLPLTLASIVVGQSFPWRIGPHSIMLYVGIHFQNYCTLLLVYMMMFEFWVLYKFYWSSGSRHRIHTCVCVQRPIIATRIERIFGMQSVSGENILHRFPVK